MELDELTQNQPKIDKKKHDDYDDSSIDSSIVEKKLKKGNEKGQKSIK